MDDLSKKIDKLTEQVETMAVQLQTVINEKTAFEGIAEYRLWLVEYEKQKIKARKRLKIRNICLSIFTAVVLASPYIVYAFVLR